MRPVLSPGKNPIRVARDDSIVLCFGSIQLFEQLVGLIEATHGIKRSAGIRMVLESHLPIGIPNLSQCDPLARVRWQLELAQGALEGHGRFQCLKGGPPFPSSESVHKSVHQGGNP